MNEKTQEMVAKGVGTLAALAAAWVVQRAISAVWKATRGHDVPSATKASTDEAVGEVVAAAVITGAVGALVRVLATRGGAKAARKVLGG